MSASFTICFHSLVKTAFTVAAIGVLINFARKAAMSSNNEEKASSLSNTDYIMHVGDLTQTDLDQLFDFELPQPETCKKSGVCDSISNDLLSRHFLCCLQKICLVCGTDRDYIAV